MASIGIAARNSADPRLESRPTASAASESTTKGAQAAAAPSTPATSAVIVELSERNKSFAAGLAAIPEKKLSPMEEKLGELKTALVGKLQKMMQEKGIAPDASFQLSVDKYGGVTTDGIHKEQIEEFFEDDPEARKALKQIVDITAMMATQKALEALVEEKKAARNKDEEDEADTRFLQRSMTIQTLSRRVTFDEGEITTGAEDYVTVDTEATTPEEIMAREAAADRLKAWPESLR